MVASESFFYFDTFYALITVLLLSCTNFINLNAYQTPIS